MLLVGVDEVNCWRQMILKTSVVTMVTKGAVAVEGRRAVEGRLEGLRRDVEGRRWAVEGHLCHWQLQRTCYS